LDVNTICGLKNNTFDLLEYVYLTTNIIYPVIPSSSSTFWD